jgi:DNA-binding NarL/FixJ family response regulator
MSRLSNLDSAKTIIMALTFTIEAWKAWHSAQDAQPDVSVIPAMLRRRLSPMGRAALSVIMPLAAEHGAMPLVFVSRHGEINRTLSLLEDLAKGELVSPATFSLSVHNAIAGLFSIQQGLTANISAIAAGDEDLVPGILESLGMCSAEQPRVLCVFCDEPLPDIYTEFVDQPRISYALALVLSLPTDGLKATWSLAPQPVAASLSTSEPQALQFLQLLIEQGASLSLRANGTSWLLNELSL